jgi:hypothetical protein
MITVYDMMHACMCVRVGGWVYKYPFMLSEVGGSTRIWQAGGTWGFGGGLFLLLYDIVVASHGTWVLLF